MQRGHGTARGKSLSLDARGWPVAAGGGGGGMGAIRSAGARWDRARDRSFVRCSVRGVPAPQQCPFAPSGMSLPHSSVPLPLQECPCPKMDHYCRPWRAVQGDRQAMLGQEPPNSHGPDMSLFPIHWDQLRDQHTSPRFLGLNPGPSPSVLGAKALSLGSWSRRTGRGFSSLASGFVISCPELFSEWLCLWRLLQPHPR